MKLLDVMHVSGLSLNLNSPSLAKDFYHPPTTSKGFEGGHANPLSPLQFRDMKVLRELFDRHDIDDIHENVQERLSQLHPEPCWDDEMPYEFIKEFL